jgi:hypothetical protein
MTVQLLSACARLQDRGHHTNIRCHCAQTKGCVASNIEDLPDVENLSSRYPMEEGSRRHLPRWPDTAPKACREPGGQRSVRHDRRPATWRGHRAAGVPLVGEDLCWRGAKTRVGMQRREVRSQPPFLRPLCVPLFARLSSLKTHARTLEGAFCRLGCQRSLSLSAATRVHGGDG